MSICDEGVFFRTWSKDREFREWFDSVGAYVEKLPDGAFLESDRATGVKCRIVVINKPLEVTVSVEPTLPEPARSSTSESTLLTIQLNNLLADLDAFDFQPTPNPKPELIETIGNILESLDAIASLTR